MVVGYHAVGLVPGDAFPPLGDLAARLRWKFQSRENTDISLEASTITVNRDGVWSLRVHLDTGSHVLEESADMAGFFARKRHDQDILANSRARLSVGSDEDSGMDYFNDYIHVCEVLLEIPSIFLFDPITGGILSEDEPKY